MVTAIELRSPSEKGQVQQHKAIHRSVTNLPLGILHIHRLYVSDSFMYARRSATSLTLYTPINMFVSTSPTNLIPRVSCVLGVPMPEYGECLAAPRHFLSRPTPNLLHLPSPTFVIPSSSLKSTLDWGNEYQPPLFSHQEAAEGCWWVGTSQARRQVSGEQHRLLTTSRAVGPRRSERWLIYRFVHSYLVPVLYRSIYMRFMLNPIRILL